MPFKNEEAYLADCIDSILTQTHTQWELLAIDDHSTDASLDIVKNFAIKEARIIPLQSNGKGIIPALNYGYSKSQGSFITRMDADDLMSSDKLTTLLTLLQSHKKPSVATAHVKYFSDTTLGNGYIKYQNWLNGLCIYNSHYKSSYRECVIPSPCWMTDRNTFDKVGAFDSQQYPEDYDLAFRFQLHGIEVISSDKILHLWRDHPLRTSRNDIAYTDNRFIKLKVYYFLKMEYTSDTPLYLWGAGKKGKKIAQLLVEKNIPFYWLSNNPKKINKSIYEILISSDKQIPLPSSKVILAVANEGEKTDIIQKLEKSGHTHGQSYFPFC